MRVSSQSLIDPTMHAITRLNISTSSDIRKIEPLLDLFEKSKIEIQYFALDLSIAVLTESMKKIQSQYQYVQCFGLWGTFNDALEWVQRIPGSKCYISMGSMFGNDHFDAAITRLKSR